MTLLERPPVLEQRAERASWWRPVLAAGAVVAVVAGAAVLAVPGTTRVAVAGETRFGGDAPGVTVPAYGDRGSDVIGYVHGASWEVRVPVRNDGAVPVEVISAVLSEKRFPLLQAQASARVGIPAGEVREVVLRGVMRNCRFFHERELELHERVHLQLRVLGSSVSREVALRRPVLVRSPMIVGCPDRKLARDEVNRTG